MADEMRIPEDMFSQTWMRDRLDTYRMNLREHIYALEGRRNTVRDFFGSSNPVVQGLSATINDMRTMLASIENSYTALDQHLDIMETFPSEPQ